MLLHLSIKSKEFLNYKQLIYESMYPYPSTRNGRKKRKEKEKQKEEGIGWGFNVYKLITLSVF